MPRYGGSLNCVENSYSPFHPSFEETLEAVRGYGNFMSLNKYLDVFQFQETIHEFHHLDKRLTAFELAVEIDFAKIRGNDVKHQIGCLEEPLVGLKKNF